LGQVEGKESKKENYILEMSTKKTEFKENKEKSDDDSESVSNSRSEENTPLEDKKCNSKPKIL